MAYPGLAMLGIDANYPCLAELQSIVSPDHFIAAARHTDVDGKPALNEGAVSVVAAEPEKKPADDDLPRGADGYVKVPEAAEEDKKTLCHFEYVAEAKREFGQDSGPKRLDVFEARDNAGLSHGFVYSIERFDISRAGSFVLAAKYRVEQWSTKVGSLPGYSPLFADWVKPRSFLIEVSACGPRVEFRRNVPVWEANTPENERGLVQLQAPEGSTVVLDDGKWNTCAVRWSKELGVVTLFSNGKKVAEAVVPEDHPARREGPPLIQRTNHPEFFIGWKQGTKEALQGEVDFLKVVAGGRSDDEVLELCGESRPLALVEDVSTVPAAQRNGVQGSPPRSRSVITSGRTSRAKSSEPVPPVAPPKPTTLFDLGKGDPFHNVGGCPINEDELRALFASYDSNGSGFIDKEEFRKEFIGFETFGLAMSERDVDRMFEKYDTRKDNHLDFNEFALLMLQRSRM